MARNILMRIAKALKERGFFEGVKLNRLNSTEVFNLLCEADKGEALLTGPKDSGTEAAGDEGDVGEKDRTRADDTDKRINKIKDTLAGIALSWRCSTGVRELPRNSVWCLMSSQGSPGPWSAAIFLGEK